MMTNNNYTLITGASSGIGQEIAIHVARSSNVIIHGRNTEKLKEIQSLCNPETKSLIWDFDLEDLENIETSLASFIKVNAIAITHFVHCAGFMKMLPLKMTTLELMTKTFRINVFSANTIVKMLTSRKTNNSSLENVVFISSNISNMGAKAMSIYGSSKSALDGLMRGLAIELAPKIRINSVLPGAVKTAMTANIFENDDIAQRMGSMYPLGIGKPEDIAAMVSFLLSPSSRWITGQQFFVDGGRSINITG
jgi:NAD(P)-dependent dehydrogenase (short-subunit alcohol dehydrogenase family)